MTFEELTSNGVAGQTAIAAVNHLCSGMRDIETMKNLLNILSDGEGLASNPRISALVSASYLYLDQVAGSVRAAGSILGAKFADESRGADDLCGEV